MLSRITGSLPMVRSYCFCLLLLSTIVAVTVAVAAEELPPAPTTFKTLNGKLDLAPLNRNAPLVIAKGGFSGVFPDSSEYAFAFASSLHISLWCDVQLTKDGVGICLRDLLMQNCTDITEIYPEGMKAYLINGAQKTGWLPVDYNMASLRNVTCIMVPKNYIWPVTSDNYIQLHTQIVQEAHNAGLEIYASDFSNDGIFPYNYSYDPLGEYLSFVSDGGFSVDGVLTDFPLTASEAIEINVNIAVRQRQLAEALISQITLQGIPLIISHNGGSGDYPGCTDLAYENAVRDGADVIDCSIQMTKDGIPICMSSIDLLATTDVQQSKFCSLLSVIPEIQSKKGIFTFNLTWDDINILRLNSCTGLGDGKPRSMKAVEIGGLVQTLQDKARRPARAPALVLKPSDVVEPPLPAAAAAAAAAAVPKTTGYSSPRSDAPPPAAAVTAISSTGILLGMVWVSLLI
ncbi:hypothetical protein OsJ_28963 [Oryza sativa Japonica Group]|uniref:glycerophosphodiester phosphodiesterase n=1 Tax=Oryza sativa subsp. japonica TaxID=39947 RepID=B9G312_ORYSJ|nr:hypothetical protein OsJ_28963 [Oryza sativa Japonica Group]